MKILFLIFTHDHGTGGHYFSYNAITESLLDSVGGFTLELGWNKSNSLNLDAFFEATPFNYFKTKKLISELCVSQGITHLHCFDIHSVFFVRQISAFLGIPMIVTRCGGKNPTSYFPHVKNLICFSKENYLYFQSLDFAANISLIPNRISNEYKSDYVDFGGAKSKFLSIGRIGPEYMLKHVKSISLIRDLTHSGYDVSLTIIGVVEDIDCLKSLKNQSCQLDVSYHTNKPLTENSARYIDNFDFSIGTGRGCMESLQRGKPTLICSEKHNIPILLDENVFESAFNKNFSMRVDCLGSTKALIHLMEDNHEYMKHAEWCRKVFSDYFCIDNAKNKYISIYRKDLLPENSRMQDIIVNWLYVLKHYIKFKVKNWK